MNVKKQPQQLKNEMKEYSIQIYGSYEALTQSLSRRNTSSFKNKYLTKKYLIDRNVDYALPGLMNFWPFER